MACTCPPHRPVRDGADHVIDTGLYVEQHSNLLPQRCRIRDPGTRGKHQTKKKKALVYQQGVCRVKNSGPCDPWLPVVKNSRLFAQHPHTTGTAHGAPPHYHQQSPQNPPQPLTMLHQSPLQLEAGWARQAGANASFESPHDI